MNRVVVVTGGTKGIGLATVKNLLKKEIGLSHAEEV